MLWANTIPYTPPCATEKASVARGEAGVWLASDEIVFSAFWHTMVLRRPLSLVVVLGLLAICISSVGALVCHNDDACQSRFNAPIVGLICVACVVSMFTLFYVEGGSMGGMR